MSKLLIVAVSLSLLATAAGAQSAEPAVCYGFAFGRWHPALDLAAAGHAPATSDEPTGPGGRSWATQDGARVPGDSAELMLLPQWWPAGVRLRAARLPAAGDTLRASAIALVADGRVTAPHSQALIWGKRCGEAVQSAPAGVTDGVAPRAEPRDTPRRSPATTPRKRP